jgi:hypothetical protein
MIVEFFKSAFGITVILGGWLTVQKLWQSMIRASPDEDALSGRLGCRGCECGSMCKRENH